MELILLSWLIFEFWQEAPQCSRKASTALLSPCRLHPASQPSEIHSPGSHLAYRPTYMPTYKWSTCSQPRAVMAGPPSGSLPSQCPPPLPVVTPELLLRDGSDTTPEEALPDPCPSPPGHLEWASGALLCDLHHCTRPGHRNHASGSLPFPLPWEPLKAEARSQLFRCRSGRAQRCTPVPDESSYICPPQRPPAC